MLKVSGLVGASVLSAIVLPAVLSAQQPRADTPLAARGTVLDATTGTPIAGATVATEGRRTITDATGQFALGGLARGPHELVATSLGYETTRTTVFLPDAGSDLKLRLEAAPLGLEGVDVTIRRDGRADVSGHVVDASKGTPLLGARVAAPYAGGVRDEYSDRDGGFSLPSVRAGMQLLRIQRLGYYTRLVPVNAASDVSVTIGLERNEVSLARIERGERELLRRRRSVARMSTKAITQVDIAESGLADPWEILLSRAGVEPVTCQDGTTDPPCVRSRGRTFRMSLCVDGFPTMGGISQMRSYDASEIYLIESYGSGRYVRIYTLDYMEKLSDSSKGLVMNCPDQDMR